MQLSNSRFLARHLFQAGLGIHARVKPSSTSRECVVRSHLELCVHSLVAISIPMSVVPIVAPPPAIAVHLALRMWHLALWYEVLLWRHIAVSIESGGHAKHRAAIGLLLISSLHRHSRWNHRRGTHVRSVRIYHVRW